MIDHLMQYRDRFGDCHVPTGNSKNTREERDELLVLDELPDWVVKQRKQYRRYASTKKGIPSHSAFAMKVHILESMGFLWSCREAQWQRSFNKLEQAYKSNKEGSLFRIKEQDDPKLYTWIEQQRKAYKKKIMPDERETLLREIGFVFDPNDARWWENYRNLSDYHETHGDTMVTALHDDGSPNYLGQWVHRQRRLYHKSDNSLRSHRIKALNELGFSWDPEGESWDNYYHQLLEFHKKHKHTRVPTSMGPLWSWVDRQRRSYRNKLRIREAADDDDDENNKPTETEMISPWTLITNENIQKLSTIGFEWEDDTSQRGGEVGNRMEKLMDVTFEISIHDENWAKHFDKLCQFHKTFRHFSVSTASSGEYKELNAWVRHTRYLYNANKLPQNRIDLLNGIGFAWTAKAARWDRLCEEFLSFHKENGHADVPAKNGELYRWTKQQKENHEYIDLCNNNNNNNTSEGSTETRKRNLNTLKKILL